MRISDWSSDVCSSDLGFGCQRDAGVVVDDVETAVSAHRRLHEIVDVRFAGYIAAARERFAAGCLHLRGDRFGVRLADVAEDESGDVQTGRASCRERGCQYV